MKIETIRAGVRYLKRYGVRTLWIRLQERRQQSNTEYKKDFAEPEKDEIKLREERHNARQWSERPLLSIVTPLYNTPEIFLRDMIESVMASSYENWQLCLVDATPCEKDGQIEQIVREYQKKDMEEQESTKEQGSSKHQESKEKECRIRYQKLPENLGISENTNQALAMADGAYIAFLDHDDVITPDALYEMMLAVKEAEEAGNPVDMLYSDEDKTNEDRTAYFEPHYKPDYNPDLLRVNNYITHFLVVKRGLLETVGGIRKEFDGAQDYDFILRCTEQAKHIMHIPKVLYHWRVHSLSTSRGGGSKDYAINAGKRAIEAHLSRIGMAGTVEPTPYFGFYHVEYQVPDYEVVKVQQLSGENTGYEHGKEKNSCKAAHTDAYSNMVLEIIRVKPNQKRMEDIPETDLSEKQEQAGEEYVLIYDASLKPRTSNWKDIMVADCARSGIGVAGGKIYDKKNRILEASYELRNGINTEDCDFEASLQNTFAGLKRGYGGYMHRANLQRNCAAVSGRCIIAKKDILDKIPNYKERIFLGKIAFDLCEKARENGLLITFEPCIIMQN